PGQRDLRPRHAARLRNLGDALDDPFVGFFGRVLEHPAIGFVGLRADAFVVPVAGQPAARLRAPGDDADALIGAEWQHLTLLLTIHQVDQVLHADEAGPAVAFGDRLGLGEL